MNFVRGARRRNLRRSSRQDTTRDDERDGDLPWFQLVWQYLTWVFSPEQLFYVAAILTATFVRAMGVTVQSGEQALLFSFGRAKQVLEPGFRMLLPFLQVVRRMPSRSRTIDLPSQRVVTLEGLVYLADANLVYRVTDLKKALVEIDNLEEGMLQMLSLGVQEILRMTTRDTSRDSEALNESLRTNLSRRLEPWGVDVEQAGFTSITPSAVTLRLTQMSKRTEERGRLANRIREEQVTLSQSLGLLGARSTYTTRSRRRRIAEVERGRRRRVTNMLLRAGLTAPEIASARKQYARFLTGEESTKTLSGNGTGRLLQGRLVRKKDGTTATIEVAE